MARVGGVVLCGGESSRMGRPKAWLPVGKETMLAHVTGILGGVVGSVVVVAAPGQELPTLPNSISVVRDPQRGRGPLQGLAAGLAALRGKAEMAFVSSCDVPLLMPAFVERMVALLGDALICVPEVGGYRHPLAGVYRVEVADAAEQLLAEQRYRPAFLFERVRTRFVQEAELGDVDPTFRSLRNTNTPAEYEAALAELSEPSGAGTAKEPRV